METVHVAELWLRLQRQRALGNRLPFDGRCPSMPLVLASITSHWSKTLREVHVLWCKNRCCTSCTPATEAFLRRSRSLLAHWNKFCCSDRVSRPNQRNVLRDPFWKQGVKVGPADEKSAKRYKEFADLGKKLKAYVSMSVCEEVIRNILGSTSSVMEKSTQEESRKAISKYGFRMF